MSHDAILTTAGPAGPEQYSSANSFRAAVAAGVSIVPVIAGSQPEAKPKAREKQQNIAGGLKQIARLAESVSFHFQQAVSEIKRINLQTKILSFNAQIESARAGVIGNAFGVVAMEMVSLSGQTAEVTHKLATETQGNINSLNQIIAGLGQDIRGTRLSDLAMTNIDVIDRNLYERSCDVRWWATDSSAVEALTENTPLVRERACQRLGVILDSYTVYFDIVLCDLQGRVVASGRKNKYNSVGSSQKNTDWFQAAIKTTDGSQFGFQGVHRSPTLADQQHILVYSCGVRENGGARSRLIGVLGVVFNWEALGQTIVCGTLISEEEKASTRVCIVDATGLVLADSAKKIIGETLALPDQKALFATKKLHITAQYNSEPMLIAHALSPGFETYATGWHSLILQRLEHY